MHQYDDATILAIHYPRTPTNFISGLGSMAEKKQLTALLRDLNGLYEHAGEEMLDYYALRQGRNLSVGPTMAELPDADEADRG